MDSTPPDVVDRSVKRVQEMILARFPDTRFRLEPGGHDDIWHLSVYAPERTIPLPVEVTEFLNQVWREHKITLITAMYSMAHYPEDHGES